MSIQKPPKLPNKYLLNPEVEKKVETYLAEHKDALTTVEVAEKVGLEFHPTRCALYNLRNANKVKIVTFKTTEIHWIHKKHLR